MNAPTLASPVTPSTPEAIAEGLERIVPLQGLPLEERLWLARNGVEVIAQAGDVLFEDGEPADRMILLMKGEIHVHRDRPGGSTLFIGRAGQMTGLLPFSRMKVSGGQGVAIAPVWALFIHRSKFAEMLTVIPTMAQRVVSTLLDRVREVTRIEQQAEKLTALLTQEFMKVVKANGGPDNLIQTVQNGTIQTTQELMKVVDVVVATPGRAVDHLDRGTLRFDEVTMVILDEADEMLDMGFAEDLDKILSALPRQRQTA